MSCESELEHLFFSSFAAAARPQAVCRLHCSACQGRSSYHTTCVQPLTKQSLQKYLPEIIALTDRATVIEYYHDSVIKSNTGSRLDGFELFQHSDPFLLMQHSAKHQELLLQHLMPHVGGGEKTADPADWGKYEIEVIPRRR